MDKAEFRSLFPAAPNKAAYWAPVYLEPMLGSGERLTALVVCMGEAGDSYVELTLRHKVLNCMYGEKGDGLLGLAEILQDSLRDHLALGGVIENWISPIKNCYLGAIRPALGESLEDIARNAITLTASLSQSMRTELDADTSENVITPDVDRWLQQIKSSVRLRASQLEPRFNGEVTIRAGASPTRIGYLGDRIAANFDALVPGANLSARRIRSKARMVDLQILRDQVDLLKRSSYELHLWMPSSNSPAYSQKYLDGVQSAFLELEEFGDKHSLVVRGMNSPEQSADRIISIETGR